MSDMIDPGLIPPRMASVPPTPDPSVAYVQELIRRIETAHDFAFAHLAEVKDAIAKLRAQAS